MRVLMIVCLSLVCAAAVFAEEDTNFEDLDIMSLVKDEEKMKVVFNCVLDRGPCGEYQKLRDMVPAMIVTECSQCSPKKKENYDRTKKYLMDKYPKEMELLAKKYLSKSD